MNLFRGKRNPTSTEQPGPRACRECGNELAEDQLACLECGTVDVLPEGRERRWMLPTTGVIAGALFLVTSASFAATTALNTGDPQAIKPKPPTQVAQAPLPPASGDGSVPESSQQDSGSEKGPDLGDLPSGGGGGGAAPPSDGGGSGDAPADDGGSSGGGSGGGGSTSGGSGGGGSTGGGSSGGGGSNSGGSDTKPDEPAPAKVSEWPDGTEGYTVIVYKFNAKSDAKRKAQEVAGKGLPAGILDSDKYPSLTPGSWLVYIGQFETQQKAEKAQQKYENAGYPGEVQFVGQHETPESDDSGDGSGGGGGGSTTPAPTTPTVPQP